VRVRLRDQHIDGLRGDVSGEQQEGDTDYPQRLPLPFVVWQLREMQAIERKTDPDLPDGRVIR
jgi:hypothetical protein